jgi:FMN phosphatase YigB (HAD superfamily)
MPKIKFVYFDLGDVLFNWRDGLKKLAAMSNKSDKETNEVFEKYDEPLLAHFNKLMEIYQTR